MRRGAREGSGKRRATRRKRTRYARWLSNRSRRARKDATARSRRSDVRRSVERLKEGSLSSKHDRSACTRLSRRTERPSSRSVGKDVGKDGVSGRVRFGVDGRNVSAARDSRHDMREFGANSRKVGQKELNGSREQLVSKDRRACRSKVIGEDLEIVGSRRSEAFRAVRGAEVIRVIAPNVRLKLERIGDQSKTVVDVSVRRSPAASRDTEDVFDNLLAVVELGEHLFVRKRGHGLMRPGVAADLVTVLERPLRLIRVRRDVGADVK